MQLRESSYNAMVTLVVVIITATSIPELEFVMKDYIADKAIATTC